MDDLSAELSMNDQCHVRIARDFISYCSSDGLNYSLIQNYIDNSLNKTIDIIISLLRNNIDDESYQKHISSIKILPFLRLAEEIKEYKKTSISIINKSLKKDYEIKLNSFKKQEEKYQLIQDAILVAAKHSNSPKMKSTLNSIDLTRPEISSDKLRDIFSILLQEGEDTVQIRMFNLWSNIRKIFKSKEQIDESMPVNMSEKLILQTVQSIKKKVNLYTQKSLQTNIAQTKLINSLESQICELKNALHLQYETELFERDIKKKFDEFENRENQRFDELFEKYREAFRKIEEVTISKNELLLRNGNLETQNLLLQQKFNDSIDENNKLKQTIQAYQLKNRKSH